MTDAPIILLPAAARRVSVIAEKQGVPAILRLSVEGGGCSGFQYKFGLADAKLYEAKTNGCGRVAV